MFTEKYKCNIQETNTNKCNEIYEIKLTINQLKRNNIATSMHLNLELSPI